MHDHPAPLADPIETLRSAPLLRDLGAATLEALRSVLRVVDLEPGAELFPDDDRIDALFAVASGRLHASEPAGRRAGEPVRVIGAGAVVDQLQRLAGSTGPLRVTAMEPTRVVAMEGDAVDRLMGHFPDLRAARDRVHRRQLLCRLYAILGSVDEAFLDQLEELAEWAYLARGELLFEQNDASDGLYFVISGRVQAIRHERDGSERALVEAGRGDVVGEVEFFTEEPRGSRVEAVRDTVLVRFSDAAFESLVSRRPGVLRHVTRSVVARAHLPPLGGRGSGRVTTVAIVGASPRARTDDFARRLVTELEEHGPVLRLTAGRVDELMDEPGMAQAWEGSPESGRLLAWLESREDRHRFVVYEAEPTVTAWTRRCLRQADRVILVAHSGDDPGPGEVEKALTMLEGRVTDAHQAIVLVHEDGTCLPTGTRRWLEPRPFLEEHHHLRWDRADDFSRLARLLAGRAVGVVLGGGGARAFAHIGILRALHEAGIPIDRIGGTSMGGSMAAQWALGWTPEQIEATNHRVWVEIQPHKRFTIPVVSLVTNKQALECGREMYGDAEIEDLWIPFFCVSSNLTTAEMVVHRRGPLLPALTATASLPGFSTPVVQGNHILVDGALLNNVPTDVMRSLGAGVVIASEVSVEEDLDFVADRIPSPWEVMRGRVKFPSLMGLVMRSTLLHSTSRQKAALDDADFAFRPPIDAFSMMDFSRLAELVETGHRYGTETIRAWKESGTAPTRSGAAPAPPHPALSV